MRLLLVTLLAASPALAQTSLRVPTGGPIIVDGRLLPDEWRDAVRFHGADGGEILLKRDASYVYLGLRATRPGFPSVCVERADTVRVLHASAALGSLVYTRAGERWSRRNEFVFGMRSPDTTAQARQQRADYLRVERWVASTIRMGSGSEKEMVIPLAFFGAPARLAIAYYVSDDDSAPLSLWPSTVADACAEKRLAQGLAPPQAVFGGRGWAMLDLSR